MTQSLSVIASTPFTNLGTQTYNIPTTGLYTMQAQVFLPYFAAGSPAQTAGAVQEVQTAITVADVAGSLNSTYFLLNSACDAYKFYVWYNINSAGVDPAIAGRTGIQVAGATNASAATLATATSTAILANTTAATLFTTSVTSSTHVNITNIQAGKCTAAADGTAATGFTFSVGTAGTFGTPEQSGMVIVLNHGTTILTTSAFPSPTQPILSAASTFSATAGDTATIVLSSLSGADAGINAFKAIGNVYFGPAI